MKLVSHFRCLPFAPLLLPLLVFLLPFLPITIATLRLLFLLVCFNFSLSLFLILSKYLTSKIPSPPPKTHIHTYGTRHMLNVHNSLNILICGSRPCLVVHISRCDLIPSHDSNDLIYGKCRKLIHHSSSTESNSSINRPKCDEET